MDKCDLVMGTNNCDDLDGLKLLKENLIDLTITSIPYDNLRTYNRNISDFKVIARELYRVTKNGGVFVWIVNDSIIKGSNATDIMEQARYFKECGFILQDAFIQIKYNNKTNDPDECYVCGFEYKFVFSKEQPKTRNVIRFKECPPPHCPGLKWYGYVYSPSQEEVGYSGISIEQITSDCILTWSNKGDIVMDIFSGSGITRNIAYLNERKYIGLESIL